MKNIRIFLFALAALLPSFAFANIGQVTTLSTSTAKTILIAGPRCTWAIIQNSGTSNVRLTIDGGSTYINPNTNTPGTDPTTTTGIVLAAGQQIMVFPAPNSQFLVPIRAIMVSGTTTIDLATNDTSSTFPGS